MRQDSQSGVLFKGWSGPMNYSAQSLAVDLAAHAKIVSPTAVVARLAAPQSSNDIPPAKGQGI